MLAVNRVYSTLNFLVTCTLAILLSMSPKLGAFLFTIPSGVLGGLSVVLFGTIAATGARIWSENKVKFGDTRNLIVMATTLSLSAGLSNGPAVTLGLLRLDGLGFSTIVAVVSHLVLARIPESVFNAPGYREEGEDEEDEDGGNEDGVDEEMVLGKV